MERSKRKRAKIYSRISEKRREIMRFLQRYMSKSDIPFDAVGNNRHTELVATGHVAGKKQMDTEPKLVRIRTSSLKSGSLHVGLYIIFQKAWHNCNYAKGIIRNNNICPIKSNF